MGFSSWAGRGRTCMTYFGPSMMGIMVEAMGRKIRGVPDYGGWSGPSNVRFSHTRTHMGARRWPLTEPERGVRLLNPSDCTAGYALLNPSDRSMAVN